MTEQEFKIETKKLNLEITEEMLQKLELYQEFLLEYNKHTNLTAIKTKEEVYLKHFYDSLTVTKIIQLENQKLLDIGSGAGFPGLVLGICFPNLKITLLDSNNKKTTFLKSCIEKLSLKNIEVVHERAENYVRKNRETFELVIARAVAELRILLELGFPALKVNGIFIAMKSNCKEEIEKAKSTLEKLEGKILDYQEFYLPKKEGFRTLINIQKEKKTNEMYPRDYDKIKKKSL